MVLAVLLVVLDPDDGEQPGEVGVRVLPSCVFRLVGVFGIPGAHLLEVCPLDVDGLDRIWASAEWVLRVDRLRDQGAP
eukprot:13054094-Heterocapsa_arctica.AAC.1